MPVMGWQRLLDQDFARPGRVDTNITGTIYLIQIVGREMRARGEVASGDGLHCGVHAGTSGVQWTKAFTIFCVALRAELKALA